MGVTIKIPTYFRSLTNGQGVVEVHGDTVGQCLDELIKEFPGFQGRLLDGKGRLFKYIEIYVNRKSTYPDELAATVKTGDELYITVIIDIAGG